MKAPKRISLEMWARRRYSRERRPSAKTLLRWVKDGKIFPYPEKEGRAYAVLETAIYLAPNDPCANEKMNAYESSAQQS